MAKSMLIVSRQPPWAGPAAREALDIALAGGAYDLPVAMLFLDDGVYQLLDAQAPDAVQQKNLAANLQALPLFGVDELFVCTTSLALRGLADASLAIAAQPLTDAQLRELLPRFDLVVTL
ncbi:sulfur relay protein TusC [Pseudomonas rhizosphaerae]|jgi:tRNA 2-thiouridine synthesizing protein C|uniref:Sulfur relay protein TusC n=1 Tax=Pseudomonas rhizosphaerae TaxID=216142 RepID=A0A089YQM8_9PSED|nr:sulfurtransferase complex subunit TusC [Pseudomonas rhizosphaerae]AIS17884.1 sulfur relay protein TusC [Pseudomonas rhizosphaerae]